MTYNVKKMEKRPKNSTVAQDYSGMEHVYIFTAMLYTHIYICSKPEICLLRRYTCAMHALLHEALLKVDLDPDLAITCVTHDHCSSPSDPGHPGNFFQTP